MASHTRFRRWASPVFRAIVHLIARVEVRGLERVPRAGPLLICSNHLGHLDPVLISELPMMPELVGAAEVLEVPVVGWLLKQYGMIPVHRGEIDRAVFERALAILGSGGMLVVAPEGRESPTGALIEGKTGPAYLAMKTGAAVLPVGLTGTKNAWQVIKRGRRARLTLTIGEPFRLPDLPLGGAARKAALKDATEKIMRKIAGLLPVEYRGVYQ